MKKRLFSMICVLVLLVCALAMTAAAEDTTLNYECEHCGAPVDWEPVVFGTHYSTTGTNTSSKTYHGEEVHLHYYLDKSYTGVAQISLSSGITMCLDLKGNSFTTNGRSINVGANSVSVMDSVGGGAIYGSAGGNNPAGGTVSVANGCTFNLYGGTLNFTNNTSSTYGGTGTGGVVSLNSTSTMNMYGGTIKAGEVVVSNYTLSYNGCGGTIFVGAGSAVNVYGGTIEKGTAATRGDGVYLAGTASKITVANSAVVEDVYVRYNNGDNLKVSGAYTGSLGVTFAPELELAQGLDVGNLTNSGSIAGATLTTTNGYHVAANSTDLLLSEFVVGSTAGIVAADGTKSSYNTLQAAINDYTDGYISLVTDTDESVTVSKDVIIAMNGKDITGTVTVADGATLYGMDSKTDDYSVSDGDYGKITKVVCEGTGKVAGLPAESDLAQDGYLVVKEGEVTSFHRVNLQIYAMSLRAEDVGVYYRCNFAADEKAADYIEKFGITLSTTGAPTAETMTKKNSSSFENFQSGIIGNLGNTNSTLLKGIMKEDNSKLINKRNANLSVYGRGYVQAVDGQIIMGNTVSRSLMEQLQGVDAQMETLATNQVQKVIALYKKFSTIMNTWQLTNIESYIAAEENGTLDEDSRLKVLVIGNSHGLDATNLLYEVFQDQAPEQNVLIGALYYSGCNVTQHKNFIKGNQPVYSYHKNSGQNADNSWTVKYNATVLDALQDEQWDIILMQQMNHRAGMDSTTEYGTYIAADWQYVIDFLQENQDNEPRLGFHMVWANPDNYELYLNDDAPYNNPSPASWRTAHENWFGGADGTYDMDVLYDSIVSCTQKYLVDTTDFLGQKYYDFVIPSATAVQYAQRCLETPRTQEEIYRDYTHMNDYGRLMVAYLWYAEIMGVDKIETVGINAIPEVLHHKNSLFPTAESGYAVDEQMKADIIESVNWALEHPFELPEE